MSHAGFRTARPHRRASCAAVAAALALSFALACAPRGAHADDAAAPATSAPPTATAATVGLLPIHGVTVDLDGLAAKRGESLAALQSLWDDYLKAAGFNVIGFSVDASDLGERGAVRVARLCEWARKNNVRIAPNLVGGPEGRPLPAEYPTQAAAFVGKVIAELGPTNAPAYAQIMLYQLGRPLNHPGSHGAIESADAAKRLKAAAENVRAAEQAALGPSGLQASPLLVAVSLDYELIRRGAIAHTALTDEHYTDSYAAVRDWLGDVLAAAPVEAVSVEWFPGSVSAEGVERMPDLMTRLQADVPGKLLIMDTGFSSAAGSDTAQARFYALALNNLCDLRARQGVDSPFAGILWRNAVDGDANAAKPLTAEQIASADWAERAKQLDRSWTDPKADAKEARAWLAGIQSSFGMISHASSSGRGLAPKTALVVISRLETALAASPVASDALAAARELVDSGKGGAGTQIKTRLQTALFGLLDAFLSKTAENLFAPEAPAAPMASGGAPALPDVQIVGVGTLPAAGTVGTPISIPVTLFNAGAAPAADAAVYLRTAQTDLAQSSPTALSPGATTTVQLVWTPAQSGKVPSIALQAYCSNDADPSTNRADLGELQVNASGGTGPRPPRHFDVVSSGVFASQLTQASPVTTTTTPGSVVVVGFEATNLYATGAVSGGGSSGGTTGGTRTMSAPAPSGSGGTGTSSGTPRSTTSAPTTSSSATTSSSTATSGTASRPITPAPAPTTSPVTITLVNPFPAAFLDAVATMRVDGRAVATRSLGTVLPRQQRTVGFTEWAPPRPGTYAVQVELKGVGANGRPMTTTASSQVVVPAGGARVRTITPVPEPARATVATRSLMPLVRPASTQPVRAIGVRPATAPGVRGGFGVRPAFAGGVLGLSANGIVLRPFPPAVDAPVEVSVQLSNLEGGAPEAARVRVSVAGEDLGEVTVQVPAGGTAVATGFRSWTAKIGRHDFRATVSAGTRAGEATKAVFVTAGGAPMAGRPGVGMPTGQPGTPGGFRPRPMAPAAGTATGGKPGATAAGGASAPPSSRPMPGMTGAPDLAIANTDIRFTPASPAAGASAMVQIVVHNAGLGAATGGQVLAVLTADGKEIARQQFAAALPGRGLLPLQWPVTMPPGAVVVTATATVAGDANPNNNVARGGPTVAPTTTPAPRRPISGTAGTMATPGKR